MCVVNVVIFLTKDFYKKILSAAWISRIEHSDAFILSAELSITDVYWRVFLCGTARISNKCLSDFHHKNKKTWSYGGNLDF